VHPYAAIKTFTRQFSAATEFCLVSFLAIGMVLVSRIVVLAERLWHLPQPAYHLTNNDAVGIAVIESARLAIILWIGRIRGWSLATFGLKPGWKWTGMGIILFFAAGFTSSGIGWLVKDILPAPLDSHIISTLNVPAMLLISVINPVAEEMFWGGYLTYALQKYGMWVTVLTSTALRTLCHAHLGMMALVSILPMGVIYGLVYWRWRQLWPLVIAHGLQMMLSLLGRLCIDPHEAGSQARYEMDWYLAGLAGILLCGWMTWRDGRRLAHAT
jgi:membrane protease YdiL (CAAX protease family)